MSKSKLRVLFLQGTSEIGGSDISLMRMIEVLDRDVFTPYAMVPSDGPLVGRMRELGCEVFIEPGMLKATTRKGLLYFLKYFFNYPIVSLRIRKFLKENQIDIVHTNTLHNFYGYLATRLAGCKHVVHIREIVVFSGLFKKFELWLAKSFTERIIVTSDAIASMYGEASSSWPKQLVKIPNSIDTEEYHPENDGSALFSGLNLDSHKLLVGLVCRLDHWKGVDDFLNAIAICHEQCPDVHFLIAGGEIEGREEYAENMYALAKELKIEDVVTFTGWKYGPSDMPMVHAALDVLVLASSWPEPFGLVLLEAMASGKPVVATNHGGPVEICRDQETALMVEPKNPQAMADAIVQLIGNPELRSRLGDAGRQRVLDHFDRRVCIKQLEKMYKDLVG